MLLLNFGGVLKISNSSPKYQKSSLQCLPLISFALSYYFFLPGGVLHGDAQDLQRTDGSDRSRRPDGPRARTAERGQAQRTPRSVYRSRRLKEEKKKNKKQVSMPVFFFFFSFSFALSDCFFMVSQLWNETPATSVQ